MNALAAKIFRDALDLTGAARAEFLHAACGADVELLTQVRKLLDAVDEDGLDALPIQGAADLAAVADGARFARLEAGIDVGPFRLVRELGTGGMGAVWMAERSAGFAQQVAIKWLHAGLSRSARERFARERALLARLEHPGIARIVDGGSSFDADWYAMEYVDGETLADYAQRRPLTLEAILKLISALCDAVQFAHQQLIVHRDLKPSNVMIAASGQPKLLDFGVAKALGETDLTQSAAPMTFAYAAPEQIKREPVTTQTDVYALGVILYELLTGARPHKPRGDGSLSLLQAITDTDVAAPSASLMTRTGSVRIKPAALKGDLDTIVLKALNREPARRYASAQALKEDLERFLALQPIVARPDARLYRLGKFVRRHRATVALSALALVAILGFAAHSALSATRAERARVVAEQEAARAQAVQNFLTDLFANQRPDVAQGRAISAKDLLDDAERRLMAPDAVESLEVRAALLDTLARLRYDLNDFDAALRHNEASIALAQTRFGERSTPHGLAVIERADTLWWLGRIDETLRECTRGLEVLRRATDQRDTELELAHQIALINCADSYRSADQFEQTRALQDEAAARAGPSPSDEFSAMLLRSRAKLANAEGDYGGAIALNSALIDRLERDPKTAPSDLATLRHGRGLAHFVLGDPHAARADLQAALDSHLKTFGPNAVHVASSRRTLALVLEDLGEHARARTEMQTALAVAQAHFAPTGADFVLTHSAAGQLAWQQGDAPRAEALLATALAANQRGYGVNHSRSVEMRLWRAEIALDRGAFAAADGWLNGLPNAVSPPRLALERDRLALKAARLNHHPAAMTDRRAVLRATLDAARFATAPAQADALIELALSDLALNDTAQLGRAVDALKPIVDSIPHATQRGRRARAALVALIR
jgi:eukaryotic-like serine/threonine-protein kinase